jgi:hypothetical protein
MSSRICLPIEVALHFSTPRGNAKSCPRELVLVGVGGALRLFLAVEVVQVAGVILAELPGGVAQRRETFGDRRVLTGPTDG